MSIILICIPSIITASDFSYEHSSFTTYLKDSSPARVNNIRLSLMSLDGKIIRPGETFSFLESIGEMKAELGYQEAPVLRDGRKIIGTGGGVCQVATTFYNTALLAGLKVIERYPHSTRINYVPAGRDATVSFVEWKDLKVLNIHPFPLVIRANLQGNRLVIGFYGSKKIDNEINIITEENRPGPGNNPRVLTWRIASEKGIEMTKELISVDDY